MKLELHPVKPNLTLVRIGDLSVFFSYKTPVAYQHVTGHRATSQNEWSNTTGKHLNSIDGGTAEAKAKRIPHAKFLEYLASVLEYVNDEYRSKVDLDRAMLEATPDSANP